MSPSIQCIRRNYLQYRGLGFLFWVPILLLNVVLPLECLIFEGVGLTNDIYSLLNLQIDILSPMFSIWWPILLLNEIVAGKSRELLYLYDRNKYFDIFFSYVLYCINLFAFCYFCDGRYRSGMDNMMGNFTRYAVVSFCMVGLVYYLSYLLHSVTVGAVLVVGYIIVAADSVYWPQGTFGYLNHYGGTVIGNLDCEKGYLVVGAIFWILGLWENVHKEDYGKGE